MIKVGDVVRVRGVAGTARVVELLRDSQGGARLDQAIRGFRLWRLEDLVKVSRGKEGKKA